MNTHDSSFTSHPTEDSNANASIPPATQSNPPGETQPYDHLHPGLLSVMNASLAARVRRVLTDVMILHPHLVGLLNEVEWLIHEPTRQRARGLVVVGSPGSGKTAVCEHITKAYPSNLDGQKRPRAVVISMSGARKTKDILNRILAATGAPVSRRYTTSDHERLTLETLQRMQCRLLVLDECQDVAQIAEREQMRVLETLKYLMNSLRMPILALGTEPARHMFRVDSHLQARFDVLDLPRWTVGSDFAAFLDALERCMPLKQPSGLSSEKMQAALIKASGGILDKILSRIRLVAVNAILDGSEQVTVDAILKGSTRPLAEILKAH